MEVSHCLKESEAELQSDLYAAKGPMKRIFEQILIV